MISTLPFDEHVAEYEHWFNKYPFVFQSEVKAVRDLLPVGSKYRGVEIGCGTGRFAEALGIKEGVEPSFPMRELALKRGIDVLAGEAEKLPYGDMEFDFAVMIFCIHYFQDLREAFNEAKRVLKYGGALIVAFIDKDSTIGQFYEQKKAQSVFYREATFYRPKKIIAELKKLEFRDLQFAQTLFHALDDTREIEPSKPGYGEGSMVVIKAIK
jgi:ubiquinone/menaquinone biosynthesis C-methylase UbiE